MDGSSGLQFRPGKSHDRLERSPRVHEMARDLPIWGMSTTETALTTHLVWPGTDLDDALLHRMAEGLKERFAIGHATFQIAAGNAMHPCRLEPDEIV